MTVIVLRLFLTIPWAGLQCVIVVFSDLQCFFYIFFKFQTTVNTGGQVVYMAQAVPAVSINNSQQPPPYSLTVNQQLYPAGYTNVNPGFQTNVNPGFPQQEQQEFKNTNLSNPTI